MEKLEHEVENVFEDDRANTNYEMIVNNIKHEPEKEYLLILPPAHQS